jgi:hypothetical protein
MDRVEERLAGPAQDSAAERLGSIEQRLDEIARDLAALRDAVAPDGDPVPRAQERLTVGES